MTKTILRIDASARHEGSVTRDLTNRIVARTPDASVITRDLATALPQIDEGWVNANFTAKDDRSQEQIARLAQSDDLIAELRAADTLVIGIPIYNFGVPAAFKAWVDLIARVGETFQYGENGPVGLLSGKRAFVAIASGGTELGSSIEFASNYVRHLLGFIGISDVTFVAADQLMINTEASLNSAHSAIEALAVAA